MMDPEIIKASKVLGRTLCLRNADMRDAAFILKLRTDEQRSRHLSPVNPLLNAQETWLREYAAGDGQAYFIVESIEDGPPLGTVRLYDARGESFCWGSWILLGGAPAHAAIESALMVYAYALDTLGFTCAHFQVHKANERVWKFHERFGAIRTAEDEVQFSYSLPNSAIRASMRRYQKYLPDGVSIVRN